MQEVHGQSIENIETKMSQSFGKCVLDGVREVRHVRELG